jgi:hypothetical protein
LRFTLKFIQMLSNIHTWVILFREYIKSPGVTLNSVDVEIAQTNITEPAVWSSMLGFRSVKDSH